MVRNHKSLTGFLLRWGPKLSKAVEKSKKFFKLWRKEIPNILNIFILFHLPQSRAITIGKNFYISSFNSFTLTQTFLITVVFLEIPSI